MMRCLGILQRGDLLETTLRQHKNGPASLRKALDGGDIAMIAMLVGHKLDVELTRQLLRR